MILFRAVGVLVILLSISVPFLGTLEGIWRMVILPLTTLLIAALTGLNAFFQWQSQWQGYRQTQYTLEYLLAKWELEIIRAKHCPDPKEATEVALAATHLLLDQAREITASETSGFFAGIQLPATRQ
jgi:hypothetical protein